MLRRAGQGTGAVTATEVFPGTRLSERQNAQLQSHRWVRATRLTNRINIDLYGPIL